jgi:hypothetical protein
MQNRWLSFNVLHPDISEAQENACDVSVQCCLQVLHVPFIVQSYERKVKYLTM